MGNKNLWEAAIVEKELPEKFSGAPIPAIECGGIRTWRNRLVERQSDGSKWICKAIVR